MKIKFVASLALVSIIVCCPALAQKQEIKTFSNTFGKENMSEACFEAKRAAEEWQDSVSKETVLTGLGKRGWAGEASDVGKCECSSSKDYRGKEIFTCTVDAKIVIRK